MIVLLFLTSLICSTLALTGPNICNETRPLMIYKLEPYHEPREVKTHRWTWKPPFRKPTSRYEFDVKMKPVLHQEETVVSVCCPGYRQDGSECLPICSSPCFNGECVEPDTCQCYPGFYGDTCYVPCSNRYYGFNCQSKCQCSVHSACDVQTGECVCDDGYRGIFCDDKCAEGYHGRECSQQCSCNGNGRCHHVHGTCDCDPGWMGPECSIRCPFPLYGHYCVSRCPCNLYNTHSCDPKNGKCNCRQGWTGKLCETSTNSTITNQSTKDLEPKANIVELLPPSKIESESTSFPKVSTWLKSSGPFLGLALIAVIIFMLRKRFWNYAIERQPLQEEFVAYNSSTGSITLGHSNNNTSRSLLQVNNRSYLDLSAFQALQAGLPPTYESSVGYSVQQTDSTSDVTSAPPLPPRLRHSVGSAIHHKYDDVKF